MTLCMNPTTELKDAITENVTNIVNFDPRTFPAVSVTEFEKESQIECTLLYKDYNISENLRLQFDKDIVPPDRINLVLLNN